MEWDHGAEAQASLGPRLDNYKPGRMRVIHEKCKEWALSRNNHNNYSRGEAPALQMICIGNAKSYLRRKAMSARGVRGWVSETWVISWGLQFVWIIIRSITVNTSSDGPFTRNPPHCFISWWSLFYEIISLTFSKEAHFLIQLFTERFSLSQSCRFL